MAIYIYIYYEVWTKDHTHKAGPFGLNPCTGFHMSNWRWTWVQSTPLYSEQADSTTQFWYNNFQQFYFSVRKFYKKSYILACINNHLFCTYILNSGPPILPLIVCQTRHFYFVFPKIPFNLLKIPIYKIKQKILKTPKRGDPFHISSNDYFWIFFNKVNVF